MVIFTLGGDIFIFWGLIFPKLGVIFLIWGGFDCFSGVVGFFKFVLICLFVYFRGVNCLLWGCFLINEFVILGGYFVILENIC